MNRRTHADTNAYIYRHLRIREMITNKKTNDRREMKNKVSSDYKMNIFYKFLDIDWNRVKRNERKVSILKTILIETNMTDKAKMFYMKDNQL